MSYCFYRNKYESSNLEITEKEITNKYQGENFYPSYPRHIDSVSVKSHRSGQQINHQNHCLLKTCQLAKSSLAMEKQTNIALEVLGNQLKDKKAKQTHVQNVRHSLEQRLKIDKVSNDNDLVTLLKDDSQQLDMNV